MNILQKITDNAENYPDRIAYSVENYLRGGISSNTLTWKQLNQYSDNLASYLSRSLNRTAPIVVYGHKHPYMLVCFLACVKSGRAYCPIDYSVPLNRIETIIKELNSEIILTTESLSLTYENILTLDTIRSIIKTEKNVITQKNYVSAKDVFYIIFTSGSTGIPKGVQITRNCLDNFIQWAITLGKGFDEKNHYVFINQAPFSFDLSVMDLYLSLYTAGTLWAIKKETQNNMKFLFESFSHSNADVWVSTPSFADVCLADKKFSKELLPHLRTFLFCGETLTNYTAQQLLKAFPDADIVNTYGPTESTVAVTEIKITQEISSKWNPLPVGKEKPGTKIFIMDKSNTILPDNKKGEIVIVGDSVSVGYWNNKELTSKVFGLYEIDGQKYRLYHTGDKGYKKDGLLFYCGRIDLQIKLHGYRIELEDIERNIMKLSMVRQAAVVPIYKNNSVKSLTAYVAVDEIIDDSFLFTQKIRTDLKNYLPEYMIPKKIVFLDALPMTANGKVNRKILGGIN